MSEKELIAIVWAMKRLRQYLLGKPFNIQTDHNALVWPHNVKDPGSRLLRWRLRMEKYKYEIMHVQGNENKSADCLSRLFSRQSQDQSKISDSTMTPEKDNETPLEEYGKRRKATLKEVKPALPP